MTYYIGVDLGGSNVRVLKVSDTGSVVKEVKEPTEIGMGVNHTVDKIIRMIEMVDDDSVKGIGLGVPGPVDTVNGYVLQATNLPGFEFYPIVNVLKQKFNKPVFMDNDANVAGLAEAVLGAGKGLPIVEYVTLSTGIGGALIVNENVISGQRGFAGEVANIIVKPDGEEGGKLNRGALEVESSGTALVKKAKERIHDAAIDHAGDVYLLASQGHEVAKAIVDEQIDLIARGLAAIAHVVDPHVFVLGGGLMKSKEYFLNELQERFDGYILPGMRGHIKLVEAELADPGAVGAAMLPMTALLAK